MESQPQNPELRKNPETFNHVRKDIESLTPKTLPGTSCEKLHASLGRVLKLQNSILAQEQVNCHRVLVQRALFLSMRTDNAQRT